jgi:hypothetical protein
MLPNPQETTHTAPSSLRARLSYALSLAFGPVKRQFLS